MPAKRYAEEFKIHAVKQITENNYAINNVAKRLGAYKKSRCNWFERYGKDSSVY